MCVCVCVQYVGVPWCVCLCVCLEEESGGKEKADRMKCHTRTPR